MPACLPRARSHSLSDPPDGTLVAQSAVDITAKPAGGGAAVAPVGGGGQPAELEMVAEENEHPHATHDLEQQQRIS